MLPLFKSSYYLLSCIADIKCGNENWTVFLKIKTTGLQNVRCFPLYMFFIFSCATFSDIQLNTLILNTAPFGTITFLLLTNSWTSVSLYFYTSGPWILGSFQVFFATFTCAFVRATHTKEGVMFLNAVHEFGEVTLFTTIREGFVDVIALTQLQKSEEIAWVNGEASLY